MSQEKCNGKTRAQNSVALQRSVSPDDTERIDWLAANLYEVNGLDAPKGQEKIEVEWWCNEDNEREVTVRSGPTVQAAFRKAIDAAMREQKERG